MCGGIRHPHSSVTFQEKGFTESLGYLLSISGGPDLGLRPAGCSALPCGLHRPEFVHWAGRKELKPTSATSLIPVSDNVALGRAHNEVTRRGEH